MSISSRFVLLVLLLSPVSGQFTVIGPQETVIAMLGGEATLSCHLSPQMDAKDMEVVWIHSKSLHLLHHYKNGQDYLKLQAKEYKGRTEFLHENISIGSVALRLRQMELSDEGMYRCLFQSPTAQHEAEFRVYVAVIGSPPHLYIKGQGNKTLRLTCTSMGWYPQPEVQWMKNEERSLTQDIMIKKRENDLFSVETSITVVTNCKVNASCFIWNPLLSHTFEASFSLPDNMFPDNSFWMVTGIVALNFIITGLSLFIFCGCKLKKAKGKIKTELEKTRGEYEKLKAECDMTKAELDITKVKLDETTNEFETYKKMWFFKR
ncbi:butyrophilin subfamily 1 member A1-like [Macrotis lagotis]|uniref:butyrophilin subfamily 1 member A1-like n=1 Tax=Macrotis lagotis TaxID=92651 RepID=UPI003D69789E